MKPKEQILKFIQKAYANAPQSDASEDKKISEKNTSQNHNHTILDNYHCPNFVLGWKSIFALTSRV